MPFTLHQVVDARTEGLFCDTARNIYRNNPNWVSPLDMEINSIFNPKKNTYFSHGTACRWYITDEKGALAGRIAAFINHNKASKFEQPTGGCGFFECVNNHEAAKLLFDTAVKWLSGQGMEAMDGPINFGENHMYWGLHVEGFDQPPGYGMNYHWPYYQQLFEDYGFDLYFTQYSKNLDVNVDLPERFVRIANYTQQRHNIRVEMATPEKIMKYGKDFMDIYNDAWQFHENFTPLTEPQLALILKDMKMVVIPPLMPFAYIGDEAVGFAIALPDMNQVFAPLKGKLSILEVLKLLWRKRNYFEWYRKRGILTRARVIIMGVRPKYQKMGVESVLIVGPLAECRKMGFKEIELSWVGDFNPKMQALQDATGATPARIHHTYRFVFDPAKRGKRSTIIARDTKERYLGENEGE